MYQSTKIFFDDDNIFIDLKSYYEKSVLEYIVNINL